jgi:MFS family permease
VVRFEKFYESRIYANFLSGFQLFFGKLYSLFRVKWVFLAGLFIFEVGSLICGVAPNSIALICGRAIAGIGSSGLFTGAMMVIAHTIPLSKRPAFMGMTAGVYGIASIVGPLVSTWHQTAAPQLN